MSDTDCAILAPPTSSMARYTKRHPITIELADDTAELRCHFADNTLGVSDRTTARMNLPTIYVGNVPYILRNKSLKIIAERGLRHGEPRARATRHHRNSRT
jgi:hypothetical protein